MAVGAVREAPSSDEIEGWKKVREVRGHQGRVNAQAARLHRRRSRHARRRARARPLAPGRRQPAHAGARRFRRRGDQGRAAGGRHAARLAAPKASQTNWKIYARNKKSLALELRKRRGARRCCCELVATADMFVESFRPGTLEKMGLGPDVLLARNPKLVIVRISGWGQNGPYRRRPGFGTLVEGMSGFASFNGFADREPVLPPMYLADTLAGPLRRDRRDDRAARGRGERRQGPGDRPAAARSAVRTCSGRRPRTIASPAR